MGDHTLATPAALKEAEHPVTICGTDRPDGKAVHHLSSLFVTCAAPSLLVLPPQLLHETVQLVQFSSLACQLVARARQLF